MKCPAAFKHNSSDIIIKRVNVRRAWRRQKLVPHIHVYATEQSHYLDMAKNELARDLSHGGQHMAWVTRARHDNELRWPRLDFAIHEYKIGATVQFFLTSNWQLYKRLTGRLSHAKEAAQDSEIGKNTGQFRNLNNPGGFHISIIRKTRKRLLVWSMFEWKKLLACLELG